MPKTPAVEVEAGGRTVRVSSPDRVIYEATDHTPEVTKLMVAEYFASVEDGLMRALRDRPTALERWTSGVRPGMKLATSREDRDADAFYQKRVPKGAPDYLESVEITFPSGRTAEEICPTEIAVPVWCAHMGTLTFHPWPVRRSDVDRPDELRLDLDPQPGTSFADAVRVAGVARELLEELGLRGYPKTSGNRGVHVFVRIEPRWEFVDVRHAAIGFGRELARRDSGVTVNWWKEERGERIFVDYNQNCRDRTIASAYSLRPILGAPVSTPMTWEELATRHRPGGVQPVHGARAGAGRRPVGDDRRHGVLDRAAAGAVRRAPGRRDAVPAGLPEDARRASARAAEQEGRGALGRRRQLDRARVSSPIEQRRAPSASKKLAASMVVFVAIAFLLFGMVGLLRSDTLGGLLVAGIVFVGGGFVLARLAWRLYRGTPGAWRMGEGRSPDEVRAMSRELARRQWLTAARFLVVLTGLDLLIALLLTGREAALGAAALTRDHRRRARTAVVVAGHAGPVADPERERAHPVHPHEHLGGNPLRRDLLARPPTSPLSGVPRHSLREVLSD